MTQHADSRTEREHAAHNTRSSPSMHWWHVMRPKTDRALDYTVKYPYIHVYFVASFPHFHGTGSLTFVSVDWRNSEARAHIASELRIQTYTEPVPLKYGKLATKYPWIYGYFYSLAILPFQTTTPKQSVSTQSLACLITLDDFFRKLKTPSPIVTLFLGAVYKYYLLANLLGLLVSWYASRLQCDEDDDDGDERTAA